MTQVYRNHKISSVSVDTWGVDFGMLDKRGKLISNPFHYRHKHTQNAKEKMCKILSEKELFFSSGIPFLNYNTLVQLYMMKANGESAYKYADKMLFISDLINYFLSGEKYSEFSIASTSQMLDLQTKNWNYDLIEKFNINKNLLCDIVPSGTVLGGLTNTVCGETGLDGKIKVIAGAQHDTASAFAAVPKSSKNSVIISSGTWSVLGIEADKPIKTVEAFNAGYSNEGGIGGSVRFLNNIVGLWIIQELKRNLESAGGNISFDALAKGAEKVKPCGYLIDTQSPEFYAPLDMPGKIRRFCARTGQKTPQTEFELARCVYDSLALTYRYKIEALEKMTGTKTDAINIVGGGANNALLNKIAADATGLPVFAGPAECTAIGNALVQFIALKEIKDINEGREIVKKSFAPDEYTSKGKAVYDDAYVKFKKLKTEN